MYLLWCDGWAKGNEGKNSVKRKRILISAYGCEPHKGSEQGVGWHWCLEIARTADIVVITRSNNRNAVEAAVPDDLADRIEFEFYDLPRAIRRLKRKEKGLIGRAHV